MLRACFRGAWGRWLCSLVGLLPLVGLAQAPADAASRESVVLDSTTTTDPKALLVPAPAPPDTSRWGAPPRVLTQEVSIPADSVLQRYRSNEEYQYDRAVQDDEKSLWERFLDWIRSLFPEPDPPVVDPNLPQMDLEMPQPVDLTWLWFILIGLAAALIVLVVFNVGGMFRRKSAKALQFSEEEENIHTLDFPTLLQQALREQDYRRAIRLRFLEMLKALEDSGTIRWRPEKTNRDYLYEIAHAEARSWYREAMLVFDYTWYGHYEAETTHYDRVDYLTKRLESLANHQRRLAPPAVSPQPQAAQA